MRLHIDRIAKNAFFDASWSAGRLVASWRNPDAVAFYDELAARAYEPDSYIRVVEEPRVIYLIVSKAACTRIRPTLKEVVGRKSVQALKRNATPKYREAPSPRRLGIETFYRIATDPDALRFSFVRNPYDRLVSTWANKFSGKPLVPGDAFVDKYLAWRRDADTRLPEGADRTLSFAEFATFAAATADRRLDHHWQLQSDIIDMPGIELNFLGRVESFDRDFKLVLDRLGADRSIRERAFERLNQSVRGRCAEYYSSELSDRVYRAYQRDFDRLGYPKSVPS